MGYLNIKELPSAREVQDRINERYDELFYSDSKGTRKPYVCVVCDEFITSKRDHEQVTPGALCGMKDVLSWGSMRDQRRKPELESKFSASEELKEDHDFLEGMAVSPRAPFYKKKGKGSRFGFSCCKRCKGNVTRKTIPRHAIVNKNYVGGAPSVLTDLTEPELAFLTPMKHYGYCFTFVGGKQKCLKGTLSFMRVEKRSITRAVATLEDMGLNQNVLILYSGKLTPWQKKRVEELCKVRTEKLEAAVKWLIENNCNWQHLNYDSILEEIKSRKPVVVDRSCEVAGENSNIEHQEVFTCYYPDGATTPTNGGFDEPGGFKEYVTSMAEKGYDLQFQANLNEAYVRGDERDILLDSCLLQFPYGIGGVKEQRRLAEGNYTTKSDLQEYLSHLSKLSQPQFQRPLFQLILYSLLSKFRLLKSSRLQLRGKTDATNLAQGLNSGDVISCITGRRLKNRYAGTSTSRKFLDAVDATAKDLPHTNEAARKARSNGEAMQHHFGMSSLFVTFTFDDENSLLVQVLSGKEVDDETPVEELDEAEVTNRAKARRSLRIEYPGIASLNYEMLFEILMEELVGWDVINGCPLKEKVNGEWVEKVGFFGKVYAVSYAVEEQGRKTLHVHMTLWVEGFKELQNKFFFGTSQQKKAAKLGIQAYSEHVCSTALFPDSTKSYDIVKSFDHDCAVSLKKRKAPEVVDDQMLRNLRNRHGYKDFDGHFASCPHAECDKTWTYEEMIVDFMKNSEGICRPTKGDDEAAVVPRARMFAKIMEFQKGKIAAPKACIDAAYQHHASCHVSTCFRCQKKGSKKRGHVCGPQCDCRYRLPDLKRRRAEILVNEESIEWFIWDGSSRSQPLAQIMPKRGKYDLFQNPSCPAVSHSKFSCNNNVSVVLDGPIGQYQHKYQEKPNQDQESADYKEVEGTMRQFNGERVHESDRPEALRRICRAAFAHNKNNVISPCFASYLIRHDSRFYYSHEFKYCPLKDVVRLHNKEEIRGMLKFTPDGTEQFFENAALDYLCRSEELESESLASFTESYYMRNVSKDCEKDEIYPCKPATVKYQHPSVLKKGKKKGQCSRGAKLRDKPVLFRVSQWMFPDTASFKADMLNCDEEEFNVYMETYAQLVLSLFMPHRESGDLRRTGASSYSYLHKLRDVYKHEQTVPEEDRIVFSARNVRILQNIQNCRSNTLRYKIKDDALTAVTEPYVSPSPQAKRTNCDDDDDEKEDTSTYEMFVDHLEAEGKADTTDNDPTFLRSTLNNFNFDRMKDLGKDGCGYRSVPVVKLDTNEDLIECDSTPDQVDDQENDDSEDSDSDDSSCHWDRRKTYACDDLVALHLLKNQPKVNKVLWENGKEKKKIRVADATGSVKSIREWAKAAFGKDRKQQRAFEVLTAAFLLTFYEDTPEDRLDPTQRHRSKYRQARNALRRLRGCGEEHNLICLLHGPGGSGKSTVINTVKAYAADYCSKLNHPFTTRTIIVTAMSGVAATLINGETTHSVLGLNRDTVQVEESEEFQDARLLIVDECSFACESDFAKMHEHLKCFMGNHYNKFGGINIVFAGDYSQLEPVNREPVYSDDNRCPEFHGALNCYIELDGMWRFKKDKRYGEIMSRFRAGTPTEKDIDVLNRRLVDRFPPPEGIQVATYTNKDRDAVNASIFDDFTRVNRPSDGSPLLSACLVFMDDLYMNDSKKTYVPVISNSVKKHFYENCTESECNYNKKSRGRVDPVLKLYTGCPMMMTQNKDVVNGEANGSRVFVRKLSMKKGEEPFLVRLKNGTIIQGVFASQVDSISVEHECQTITPREFDVKAETFSFQTKMTVGTIGLEYDMFVSMRGTQFPIISNSCTTGHKLQGCSVDDILANDWYYGANWAYVVLSRVRTLKGLYLRKPLSKDLTKYAMKPEMRRMIRGFRDTIAVQMLDEQQYAAIEAGFQA